MIHFKPEHRDAIHLAVEPVIAACNLDAGQKIGIIGGKAYPIGTLPFIGQPRVPYHGIVDPFLPRKGAQCDVKQGETFWFVMAPRMVQSLRHVWEHPDFPLGE